jgi:hypothetical protein
MAIDTRKIKATDETTLDDVLDAADDGSVRIERDGVEYLLYRDTLNLTDEWDEERAKRVRKMLAETAGILRDIDLSDLIADIKRRRGDDTDPSDWP